MGQRNPMADIKYVLEIWNPVNRRYHPIWVGNSIEWANKMYNKPYNACHTRRVVMISREVLFKDKGKK